MHKPHEEDNNLSDLVVVYRARIGWQTEEALRVLDEAGLHPILLDHPNILVVMSSMWTYMLRIGVPADEADKANEVIEAWEKECVPRAGDAARRFRRMVFFAAVPTILLLIIGLVLSWEAGQLAFAAFSCFLLVLIVAAIIDRNQQKT